MDIRLLLGSTNLYEFKYLLPEITVFVGAFVLFLLDIVMKNSETKKRIFLWISILFLALSMLSFSFKNAFFKDVFSGTYTIDTLGTFSKIFEIVLTLMVLPFLHTYMNKKNTFYYEVYYITFLSLLGMMTLSSSYNLIVIYVSLEMVSISFYIMTALFRGSFISKEGAYKYLIIGGISIIIALYGAAFMYGASKSLDIRAIMSSYNDTNSVYLIVGMILFLLAFAIKIGIIPFHFWLPDAYTAAPTPITGFMASAGKLAFFIPLLRLVPYVNQYLYSSWMISVSILAAITMIVGNALALVQSDLKRLLAYSSIAHSGYILSVLSSNSSMGLKAAIYFVFVYSIMGLGAFLVLSVLEQTEEWDNQLPKIGGLYRNTGFLSISFAVFIFALLGIPPTVGFVGKALVFLGLAIKNIYWLGFVLILATAISTGYYVRIVVLMFMKDVEIRFKPHYDVLENVSIGLLVFLTFILGMFPFVLWNGISNISEFLFKIANMR
jgi:NADH dehydrogenase subunit N (EC 1.6.5.3)